MPRPTLEVIERATKLARRFTPTEIDAMLRNAKLQGDKPETHLLNVAQGIAGKPAYTLQKLQIAQASMVNLSTEADKAIYWLLNAAISIHLGQNADSAIQIAQQQMRKAQGGNYTSVAA